MLQVDIYITKQMTKQREEKNMKKILAIVLTIVVLCAMGGWSNPQDNNDETQFSLIQYLETHEIENYSEFEDLIASVSPESVEDIDSVSDFSINIDYDNQLVIVTTLEKSLVRSGSVSDTAYKSYYSDLGLKIFTVSVTGRFNYSTGYCSTASASGSFKREPLSTWTSTPTISTGNFSSTVAYARISGTATSGSSSTSYCLTMTCDDSGDLYAY